MRSFFVGLGFGENSQMVEWLVPGLSVKVKLLSLDHDSGWSVLPGSARTSTSAGPLPSALCQNIELLSRSRSDVNTIRLSSRVQVGRLFELPSKVSCLGAAFPRKSYIQIFRP